MAIHQHAAMRVKDTRYLSVCFRPFKLQKHENFIETL